MYWFYDYYYIILVVPALLLALYAQFKVKSTFNKYSQVHASCGKTAGQLAREMLDEHGLTNTRVERVSGTLTDHFDPKAGVVRLSDSTCDSTSVAALGVAAHEVGHAIQYDENYAPIKIRAAIIPVTQIGSSLALPLAVLGFFLRSDLLVTLGILLYATVVLFQLITLPVEFNASRRALETLRRDDLLGGGYGAPQDEYNSAKKVLTAAAMTYLAAMLVALMNLLRLILRARGRRD